MRFFNKNHRLRNRRRLVGNDVQVNNLQRTMLHPIREMCGRYHVASVTPSKMRAIPPLLPHALPLRCSVAFLLLSTLHSPPSSPPPIQASLSSVDSWRPRCQHRTLLLAKKVVIFAIYDRRILLHLGLRETSLLIG